jgi:signal transduction histidine kinase
LSMQNSLLANEVSIAQSKASKARNRISKLLHGTTQGRLASVSLALAAAANADSKERLEMLLKQAREQLALAEFDLDRALHDSENQDNQSLEGELQALVEGWRNLVLIRHLVSSEAVQVFTARPELLPAVAEAMQECVTNAVRHGNAAEISINVYLDPDLVLEVWNDGKPVSEIVPGFGIRAIYERATNVQIDNRGELTVVMIRWALAPN